jgi:hypothetical protein
VTRREALRLSAAAAFAPLAAPVASAALTKDEIKKRTRLAVSRSVAAEQTAMVAFEAIANGGLLDARATATMRILLDHATQHASVLGQSLKSELGQDPPLAPTRTAIRGLTGLRRQHDALELAVRLLEHAIAMHLVAVRQSLDAALLKATSGIVGSDAQSLVLLRQLLHTEPVPSAFERGAA